MKVIPPVLLLFAAALVLSFISCNDNNNGDHAKGDMVISGDFYQHIPEFIILEELTPSSVIEIDSIFPNEKGHYEYSLYLEQAGFYRLRTPNGAFITISGEPNENIYISADGQKFRETYEINGSQGSLILWQLNKMVLKGLHQADSLRSIYRENRYEPGFAELKEELQSSYNDIKEEQTNFVIDIIENNPQSLASILALYQYFEDQMLVSEEEHFEYFEKLGQSLCNVYPTNKHVMNLKKRVNEIRLDRQNQMINEENLAIGKTAPDITLPDPEGNLISLSSFEGNLVLIDFWASWCPPCRKANRLLRNLYDKYNSAGFEIYAISLDRTQEKWTNAIKRDNISWTQVSDLRFMNSPVVNLYNVTEVPHYVLLDHERKIIARNFTIQELEGLIKENLRPLP
ncbi:MAG: TlpA family protein disulfide reductase [Bacteroidota bacterium]